MVSEPLRTSVIHALESLEETATIEDLIERLYLLAKVQRGFEDVEASRVVAHEAVKAQFLGQDGI